MSVSKKEGKKVGRPKRTDLDKIKKPGKPGRPPGHAAAIKEFTARIINSPKSRHVMDKIVEAALDDDHKNQAAAWKLLMDRMLPLSAFEKGEGGARPTININIGGVENPSQTTVQSGETFDHEREDSDWEGCDQGSDT